MFKGATCSAFETEMAFPLENKNKAILNFQFCFLFCYFETNRVAIFPSNAGLVFFASDYIFLIWSKLWERAV